jgi:hypothetical protein
MRYVDRIQMEYQKIIDWLLKGDVSIQYQVYRDLLQTERKDLQDKIASEGWGKQFLSRRNSNGHWGKAFYQPKWTSSHYTLLDLRNLNLNPENPDVKETIQLILDNNIAEDGGVQLGPSTSKHSDVCVNGMFLNYASYFKTKELNLHSIVDCFLNDVMPDGGFNCRVKTSGARHSSLHTTLSVIEGIYEFQKTGYPYRKKDLHRTRKSAEEFILMHQLFLSDRTGRIINENFLKMPYASRWKYDILRAMDYFQFAGSKWDERMRAAFDVVLKKRNENGTWNTQSAHPGKTHFIMEKAGKPGRWNTLRALRIIKHFEMEKLTLTL